MWFNSVTESNVGFKQYLSVYSETAISRIETALIAATAALNGVPMTKEMAYNTQRVLLEFLLEIKHSQFLPVGFPEKLRALIQDSSEEKVDKTDE